VREERRFIAYHALTALITAADHPHVQEHLKRIETAAIESGKELPGGSDRWNAWRRLTERIASLRAQNALKSPNIKLSAPRRDLTRCIDEKRDAPTEAMKVFENMCTLRRWGVLSHLDFRAQAGLPVSGLTTGVVPGLRFPGP
jgi:hypothetical protein